MLEGARPSVIAARKACVLHRSLRLVVSRCGGHRSGAEAPVNNVVKSSAGLQRGLRSVASFRFLHGSLRFHGVGFFYYSGYGGIASMREARDSCVLVTLAAGAQRPGGCGVRFLCSLRRRTRRLSSLQLSTARALPVCTWAPVISAQRQRFPGAPHIGAVRGTTGTGSPCLGQVC